MKQPARPTIGVLVAWPVYYGTDIQRYLHATLQGIRQAAIARDCNLLLACGMDEMPQPRSNRPAWPTSAPNTNFVPVGPWNTDGLIVSAIDLTPAQERYLGEIAERGHPILYAGFVGPGVSVHLDNASGVEQALIHLHAHGHRRVAFIAGRNPPSGESAPRLEAFLSLSQSLGMELDARLIAHGDLLEPGGRRAMQQILATGAPFSAVLACNDSSAFGAAQVLREHGLRIPQDVALIGFDNLLETSAFDPPLTTIHNPAFSVGKIALDTMWEMVHGNSPDTADTSRIQTPVRLLVRRSCGCRAGAEVIDAYTPALRGVTSVDALAEELAATAMIEARLDPDEKRLLCRALVTGFSTSVLMPESDAFMLALLNALQRSELAGDGAQPWRRAFARLSAALTDLLPQASNRQRAWATDLILRARQLVSELAGQASTRALLRKENLAITLGLMSSQMLAVMDMGEVSRILSEHLPQLGVNHILAARFVPEDEDEVARSEIVMRYDATGNNHFAALPTSSMRSDGSHFVTRHFPPPGLYPDDHSWQLALLPLDAQDAGLGFVALDAANLEPSAAIVRSLAAVMRAAKLYGDALHGREQAEEANRLKGRFLSTVSHELRTPLNLIVGLSELLLRNQPSGETTSGNVGADSPAISPEISSDLARIYVNAQHLARLIGDVLDLASSDAGQLRVLRETLDAADLLRPVATTGEQMAREKGLAWHVEIAPDLPQIMGDSTRLRQVLLNLLSNAVKYTDTGSITLRAEQEAGRVTFSVIDTGIGIAPADQARIFAEFERAESGAVPSRRGLGLGLAICRQLVELHHGMIGVESSGVPGRGSRFYFVLPALDAEADADALPQGLGANAPFETRRTILIVDDDPGILDLNTRILRQHDPALHLLQAHDGAEALEIMRRLRPDLLLLDLMMPEVDGFGVLAAMHQQETLRTVPVVVLTAQSLTDEEMMRLGSGVAAVLNKGLFSADEVVAHLERAIARTRRVGAATQRLVRQAVVYIHQHHAESLSRRQIAAAVGITEDYLTQCFQQEIGITPTTYLQRYRVRRAQQLLEESDLSITDVSLTVGFADSTYFGRIFQRETGCTPSAWRRGQYSKA